MTHGDPITVTICHWYVKKKVNVTKQLNKVPLWIIDDVIFFVIWSSLRMSCWLSLMFSVLPYLGTKKIQLSVFHIIWCSNFIIHIFLFRIWNPNTEMVTSEWSPFKPTPWLMPLLSELSDWRSKLSEIEKQLDEHIDVTFVADFPGEID